MSRSPFLDVTVFEVFVWFTGMVGLAAGETHDSLLILSIWMIWIADVERSDRRRGSRRG